MMSVKELLNCDLATFGKWVSEHQTEFCFKVPFFDRESYYEYFDESLCVELSYPDFMEMLQYLKTMEGFSYHHNVDDGSIEYMLDDKIVMRKFTYSYIIPKGVNIGKIG